MANNRSPMIFENKVTASLAALVFLAACASPKPARTTQSDSNKDQTIIDYVAAVRASTLSGYPAAPIGKAFEAAFRDPKWQTTETSEGVRVVSFTGRLPPSLHRDCLDVKNADPARPCVQDATVTFRWTFPAGSRQFHLSYVDPEPWPTELRSTREILLFIYG